MFWWQSGSFLENGPKNVVAAAVVVTGDHGRWSITLVPLVMALSMPWISGDMPVVLRLLVLRSNSPIFISSVDLQLLVLMLTSRTSEPCLNKLVFTPETVAPSALHLLKTITVTGTTILLGRGLRLVT